MPSGRSTLKTLLRVGRALSAEDARDEAAEPGKLRSVARSAAGTLLQDSGVQERAAQLTDQLRSRVRSLRTSAQEQADAHLERLVLDAEARRGTPVSSEVAALLETRRQERETRRQEQAARLALLAHARTAPERRVLTLLAAHTRWAGGTAEGELRYTTLLDTLAPGGRPDEEMKIHRALWTLAEARVLAVSPHGAVTACRPGSLPAPAHGTSGAGSPS